MPDIVAYTNLPEPEGISFDDAITEISSLQDNIVFHESQLVVLRFEQGRVVYHMDKPYGSGAVDKMAEITSIHRDTLKAAERLYAYFGGDKREFMKWVEDKKRNWKHVLGLIRADYDPKVLGEDAFAERLKRRIERLLGDLHDMSELAEEGDEEAAGVIQAAATEVAYFSSVTLPKILGDDTLSPKSEDYLEFVRGLPCAFTGGVPAEPHHVSVGGTGMIGSDFTAIPVTRKVHDEIEDKGVRYVEEKYNTRVGAVVANSLHRYLTGVPAMLPAEVQHAKRQEA